MTYFGIPGTSDRSINWDGNKFTSDTSLSVSRSLSQIIDVRARKATTGPGFVVNPNSIVSSLYLPGGNLVAGTAAAMSVTSPNGSSRTLNGKIYIVSADTYNPTLRVTFEINSPAVSASDNPAIVLQSIPASQQYPILIYEGWHWILIDMVTNPLLTGEYVDLWGIRLVYDYS